MANFTDFRELVKKRHNIRWRMYGQRLDESCRIWMPTLYITCLLILFNIECEDGYTVRASLPTHPQPS